MTGEASKIDRRVIVVLKSKGDRDVYTLTYKGKCYFEDLHIPDRTEAKIQAVDHLRAARIIADVDDIDIVNDRRRF